VDCLKSYSQLTTSHSSLPAAEKTALKEAMLKVVE